VKNQPEHPIRRIVREQGRKLTWLARELDLSYGYLNMLLLPPNHHRWRQAPSGFYRRVATLLDVPESDIHWPGGGVVRRSSGATH